MTKDRLWMKFPIKLTGFAAALMLLAAPVAASADTQSAGASNTNDVNTSINIENDSSGDVTTHSTGSGAGGGNIDSTGPNSDTSIKTDISNNTSVTNNNNVSVNNVNNQTAKTGNCVVKHNTYGGSAICGVAKQEEHVPPVPPTPPTPPTPSVPKEHVPSQKPEHKVLSAAVTRAPSAPVGGLGAGQVLAVTGTNAIPGILVGIAILGLLATLTYLTTGKRFILSQQKTAGATTGRL